MYRWSKLRLSQKSHTEQKGRKVFFTKYYWFFRILGHLPE